MPPPSSSPPCGVSSGGPSAGYSKPTKGRRIPIRSRRDGSCLMFASQIYSILLVSIHFTSRPLRIPFRPLPCICWQPFTSPIVCHLAMRSSGGTGSCSNFLEILRRLIRQLSDLVCTTCSWGSPLVRRSSCSIPRLSNCFIRFSSIVYVALLLPCPLIPSQLQ